MIEFGNCLFNLSSTIFNWFYYTVYVDWVKYVEYQTKFHANGQKIGLLQVKL